MTMATRGIKNKIWIQKDGTKIRLGEMTQEHLINTAAMLERNAKFTYDREIKDCASISFGGEQAQMDQDRFLSQAEWEDYLPEIYWDIKELIV
jgi:hypothetical protein